MGEFRLNYDFKFGILTSNLEFRESAMKVVKRLLSGGCSFFSLLLLHRACSFTATVIQKYFTVLVYEITYAR